MMQESCAPCTAVQRLHKNSRISFSKERAAWGDARIPKFNSQHHQVWKTPLRSSSPTSNLTLLGPAPNHVPKCHMCTSFWKLNTSSLFWPCREQPPPHYPHTEHPATRQLHFRHSTSSQTLIPKFKLKKKKKKSTLERDLQSSSSPSTIPARMFCAKGPRAASSLKPC